MEPARRPHRATRSMVPVLVHRCQAWIGPDRLRCGRVRCPFVESHCARSRRSTCSFPTTATRLTGTSTVRSDISVFGGEFVVIDAVRLSSFVCCGRRSVSRVLSRRDGFEMIRSHAQGHFTSMVHFKPGRNRPFMPFERPPVRRHLPARPVASGEEHAVSSVRASGPQPTIGRLAHVLPESFFGARRFRFSFHHECSIADGIIYVQL